MIGMLWFDNSPADALAVKVERAAAYYRRKYEKKPTLCFVHPSMLPKSEKPDEPEQPYLAGEIEVRRSRSVLPNHFWIGVDNPPAAVQPGPVCAQTPS